MSLALNHRMSATEPGTGASSQLSHGSVLPTQLECQKEKKKDSRHFINLSLVSNCVILKLCKTYVNTIASHTGFHKYICCVFLTLQVSCGRACKKCQDFKLKKTLTGQPSSGITVSLCPEAQSR